MAAAPRFMYLCRTRRRGEGKTQLLDMSLAWIRRRGEERGRRKSDGSLVTKKKDRSTVDGGRVRAGRRHPSPKQCRTLGYVAAACKHLPMLEINSPKYGFSYLANKRRKTRNHHVYRPWPASAALRAPTAQILPVGESSGQF